MKMRTQVTSTVWKRKSKSFGLFTGSAILQTAQVLLINEKHNAMHVCVATLVCCIASPSQQSLDLEIMAETPSIIPNSSPPLPSLSFPSLLTLSSPFPPHLLPPIPHPSSLFHPPPPPLLPEHTSSPCSDGQDRHRATPRGTGVQESKALPCCHDNPERVQPEPPSQGHLPLQL